MDSGYVLSVSQLNEYVGTLLQRDILLNNISVRGEIGSFKRHSSGHLYFSLKDEGALVRCVMFRQNALSLDFLPADGMQVTASGNVSLYVKDGQYQLYVRALAKEGEGELYRRFLLLKTKLAAAGLFDEAHKRPLPLLPKCVGVVTSQTGAVIRDIVNVARRRYPSMNIALYPVQVQGGGAAEDIARGIRKANKNKLADVLIVGRGGGSMEDLWAFNEEAVANAIYESEIPVVSAVGHETDFTIADFTADMRAPTPSAAAELCVPEYAVLQHRLDKLQSDMLAACEGRLAACRERVLALKGSAALQEPGHSARALRQEAARLQIQLQNAARGRITAAYGACQQLEAALLALGPKNVLKRGYALVLTADGYVGTARELAARERAEICMQDGAVQVRVEGMATEGEHGNG